MIFRNRVAKMNLVEQLTLVTLQTAHHGSTSPIFVSTQRNHGSWPLSTDFCNKICQKATSRAWSEMKEATNRGGLQSSPHNTTFGHTACLAVNHRASNRRGHNRSPDDCSSDAALRHAFRLAIDDCIGRPGTHGNSDKQRKA